MVDNMKKLCLISVIGCLVASCAGSVEKIAPEQTTYQKIYETTLTKDKAYDKSLQWIAHTFKSAKAVIEYQDKEAGKIVGNGSTSYSCGFGCVSPVTFTMAIDIKDRKIRMVFDNVQAHLKDGSIAQIYGTKSLDEIHSNFATMCEDLNNSLNKKDDNW